MYKLLNLPKISDPRGNLSFLQANDEIPFDIRRVFWIYDVPGGYGRGGHAYQTGNQVIVALSGSFDLRIDDGKERKIIQLNRSYNAVLIKNKTWRELNNFSTNSLALIVCDTPYDEQDYIRDYEEFIKLANK